MIHVSLALALGGRPLAQGQSLQQEGDHFKSNPYVCRSWRAENGLPQNSVMAIVQTRDGYLWVGTANGLVRFDGLGFKRYGLAEGLPSLWVRTLVEGPDGSLWIGTGNGLSRYRDGKFTSWTSRDGLAGDPIMALAVAGDGTLWIGTSSGLNVRRNEVFEEPGLPANLAHSYVQALVADRAGAVWISMPEQNLMCWDGRAFLSLTNLPSQNSSYRLLEDRAGRIWAGKAGEIFCREGNGSWKRYGSDEGLPRVSITAMSEGADGTLWVGSLDQGIYFLRDGRFHRITQPNGLDDEAIQAILEDGEGNIWVGTKVGGLTRVKHRQLTMWTVADGERAVSPLSLAESADGTMWGVLPGRGIYRIDRLQEPRFIQAGLANQPTYGSILITRDNSLWCSASSSLYQWQDGKLVKQYRDEPRLRGDPVRCLCEDRQAGIWLGTRSGKLLRLRNGEFKAFTNGIPRAPLSALTQGRDGSLWIGSAGGGLGRLTDERYALFGRPEGLRSEFIYALYLDSRNQLWIGTQGGGLGCLAGGAIRTISSQHGLEDDSIAQILEDEAGHLWLGTFHGICQLLRRDLDDFLAGRTARVEPRAFGRPDGMGSEQCAVGFNTCLKTRDGLLCFSTDRGVAVIDPRARRDSSRPPAVRLETVLLAGQAQTLPHGPGGEHAGVEASSGLTVPAGQQQLEFRFTGLYFSAPERVRYRYRLDGFDADWIEAGAERVARYRYVPPGSYQFRVNAHNGNGLWSESGVVLPLTILPHFWETWWFRVAAWLGGVALASGIVFAVLRRRLKLRMQALERQRAIEQERRRIAQDMHDELGSRLTKAGMVAQSVARDLDESPGPRQRLHLLRQTLDDMTVTMDALVWAVNPRHDTLDGLANYLIRFSQEFFADTTIRCELDIPADLPAVPLTAAVRHNLFLAFKEALNNAAKHAAPTDVGVRVEYRAGRLAVQVKDNGAGFSANHKRVGGRGLENMRERLKAIGGSCELETHAGGGTRVRFEVTLGP